MRDARIRGVIFGDDEYDFRLGWGELVELQEACSAGPHFVLNRLHDGTWRVEDISETIRLGLMGADKDMKPSRATELVKKYVKARPPLENLLLATVILKAALMGSPEEVVGEPEAANQTVHSTTSQMDESDLPPSMVQERSSGSRRRKSMQ